MASNKIPRRSSQIKNTQIPAESNQRLSVGKKNPRRSSQIKSTQIFAENNQRLSVGKKNPADHRRLKTRRFPQKAISVDLRKKSAKICGKNKYTYHLRSIKENT